MLNPTRNAQGRNLNIVQALAIESFEGPRAQRMSLRK